jgi:hypothetical protein
LKRPHSEVRTREAFHPGARPAIWYRYAVSIGVEWRRAVRSLAEGLKEAAAALMILVHFGPHLRLIGPIARYLHTARLGMAERRGDVSCGHRMQVHLIARQADAVVDEVATIDRQ